MKKACFVLLAGMAVILSFCTGSKKSGASAKKANVTYMANVEPIISSSCAPCHIPPKGRVKALNSYTAAKDNIDDVIARIQRNPGEKGFMPMKHPKLSSDTINVFVQWKADGLLEK
jgi:hypothetical protein